MDRRSASVLSLTLVVVVALLLPAGVLAKGGKPVVESTNNLSYPAIAVDGFGITPLAAPSFSVPYAGTYPDLTADEIAALEAAGPWYPQKTTGNAWQAEYALYGLGESADVTYVDWGDNIESVNPKVGTPFRLEVVLFKDLGEVTMSAYTMGVLEYPSSTTELQGTNTNRYDSQYATVISAQPKLVIQYLGTSLPTTDLVWSGTSWDQGTIVPISFAPELNVGGKYIFGASEGGWKPAQPGYYRITFYAPAGSGVNLVPAIVQNAATGFTGVIEGTAATPKMDPLNNLSYVDVKVNAKGGRK